MKEILLMKTKAMRIQAELSAYLWLWIIQTADYYMNRTSSAKYSWKTSFEMIIDKKLNLAHLIQYEAKAYLVDKNISRREKMKTRAHIDFLMSYDSTNIYFIWTFNQWKVFKICDVIFDENNYY